MPNHAWLLLFSCSKFMMIDRKYSLEALGFVNYFLLRIFTWMWTIYAVVRTKRHMYRVCTVIVYMGDIPIYCVVLTSAFCFEPRLVIRFDVISHDCKSSCSTNSHPCSFSSQISSCIYIHVSRFCSQACAHWTVYANACLLLYQLINAYFASAY